jgi:CHAD domain-containing protein
LAVAGGGEPDIDVRRLVAKRLAELVEELQRYDPLVRADVPDAVHRMRVTIRRLRSNLATFRPFLDRTVVDPLRDELMWFGGVLGEARDAEVLRAGLIARLSDDPAPLVRGGVTEFVDDELAAHYRDAHLNCLQVMAGDRYARLVSSLVEPGGSPPWADGPVPSADALRKRVRNDWIRLGRRAAALRPDADDEEQAARFHEVRKAAKRVRYAVEPLVAPYGEPAARLADAMKSVQSLLGDHQDAVVATRELLVLSESANEKSIDAFELGRLHERELETARETAAGFEVLWREVSRSRYHKWL